MASRRRSSVRSNSAPSLSEPTLVTVTKPSGPISARNCYARWPADGLAVTDSATLRSRGFALQHRNVGIEPERPDRCSQNEEPGRNDERCLPGTVLNQRAEHDRRQSAADIAGHVHHAGNRAGTLAANVHRNGPGRTDRALEKEHRAGQAVLSKKLGHGEVLAAVRRMIGG